MQYLKSYEQFSQKEVEMVDEGLFSTDWTNKDDVTKKMEKHVVEYAKKYFSPYTFDKASNKFKPTKETNNIVATKEEAKTKEGSQVMLNNKGGEKPQWLIKGTPEFQQAVEAAMKLKTDQIYYRVDTKEFAKIATGRFQTV